MRVVEFRKLAVGPGGEDAGRSLFEDMTVDLVGVLHPGCRSVRANPGDWGIDAYVGQLEPGGAVHIWQAKYFPDGIDKSQQAQIRDAYGQALKAASEHGHSVASWTLCVPCTLSGPETTWWNGWRKRQKDGVDIDLWPEERMRRLILSPEAGWIYDAYFSDDPADRPRRRVVELTDEQRYDGALFVHQLHKAGIGATAVLADAKRAYFNAELVQADVLNRESEPQQRELEQVRIENHSIWSTEFVAASADDGASAGTYAAVLTKLRSHHQAAPPGSLRLHFIHRDGVMHQLVDDGAAGWCAAYEQVAEEHAS